MFQAIQMLGTPEVTVLKKRNSGPACIFGCRVLALFHLSSCGGDLPKATMISYPTGV
jgi:hypothetical protein